MSLRSSSLSAAVAVGKQILRFAQDDPATSTPLERDTAKQGSIAAQRSVPKQLTRAQGSTPGGKRVILSEAKDLLFSTGPRKQAALTLLAAAALLPTGCTVGPSYKRPTAPTPTVYRELPPPPGDWKSASPADAALRGDWWTLFNDQQLNALEAKVPGGNQTLQAALEHYTASREAVREARADFYPTLGVGPNIQREHLSYNRPTRITDQPVQFNDYVLSGQGSWEPDFWGRVRREVEAARSNAQAAGADLANTELSIRAELAVDYYELRGLDAQQRLLDDTVRSYQDFLALTERRQRGGVATESDVALAQTQLATTQTTDIDVAIARAQYEHAIATLIGVPASSFTLPTDPLTPGDTHELPTIPTGVPSALLERRPDIALEERLTQSANAQIGIAISAYYPNVTLTGTGGFETGEPGTWIQGPSELWSVGASALETLFDAGRRRSITEQARASYRQQAATYRETVLGAFQDVEDNLASIRILANESVSATNALTAANRSLTVSTGRYKGGVTTYLEVLTAQQALLANERTQADVTTRQYASTVQLIRALGGGWTANGTTLPAKPEQTLPDKQSIFSITPPKQ